MQVYLVDVEEQGERRSLPAYRHGVEERRVGEDACPAVDAECVLAARYQIEQPGVRVLQDVVEGVGPPVSRPVRQGRCGGVQDVGETGQAAARGDVAVALRVGGGGPRDSVSQAGEGAVVGKFSLGRQGCQGRQELVGKDYLT
ncbi:hypothetical protein ADK76_14070 [Streptomyces griseoflavus]|nr:hypothetical protein ADK76_14070 [Streptomyces griseoflavus]